MTQAPAPSDMSHVTSPVTPAPSDISHAARPATPAPSDISPVTPAPSDISHAAAAAESPVPADISRHPVPTDMSAGPRLRPALAADLPALLAIKRRLHLEADAPARGGFLLGGTPEQYTRLIAGGRTHVLTRAGVVVGFSAALADAELRASELWQRRAQIDLGPRRALLAELERQPLAYLDQLAVLPEPGLGILGVLLAYHALASLFAEGCALVVTTVVAEPVRNLASRPLLAAVGALQVGRIAERYEGVGAITSDVFVVPRGALDPESQDDPRRSAHLRRLAAASHELVRRP